MTALRHCPPPHVEPLRDGVLIRLAGQDLTEANARDLLDAVYDFARNGGGPHLYLDLARLEHLARPVLLRLMVLDRKLHELGDRLVLLNASAGVRQAIHSARLADLLEVHEPAAV
jgi:anti-anti-sigma regulatory factor